MNYRFWPHGVVVIPAAVGGVALFQWLGYTKEVDRVVIIGLMLLAALIIYRRWHDREKV
jgi:hypothetical protein